MDIYFALCVPRAAECRKIFFSVRSSLAYLLCYSFLIFYFDEGGGGACFVAQVFCLAFVFLGVLM